MVKKDGVSIVEVIVVDDVSQVSIEPVMARFYDQLDLTLITQTNAGLAQARNKAQQGQRVIFGYLLTTTVPCF